MLTAGTYRKQPLFSSPKHLDSVLGLIFRAAEDDTVRLHAWAVLRSHYHLVADFSETPEGFCHRKWLAKIHGQIARAINALDQATGRRVMYQFWDTRLTYEKSWMARLHYVHTNPVHHCIVPVASQYCWCSAAWFETNARRAFVDSVYSFKIDRLSVNDDF